MRTNLRWEAQEKSFWAYSGDLIVGMILQPSHDNAEGKWLWTIDAVFMKHIARGRGYVATRAGARKALERAWQKWLDHAGLAKRETTL